MNRMSAGDTASTQSVVAESEPKPEQAGSSSPLPLFGLHSLFKVGHFMTQQQAATGAYSLFGKESIYTQYCNCFFIKFCRFIFIPFIHQKRQTMIQWHDF